MTVRDLTDNSFAAEVLQSATPVLVQFWAEWCGPCRRMSPVVDAVAADHADRLTVVRVNVDHNPMTAAQLQIASIPAFVVFSGGQVVASMVGSATRPTLEKRLLSTVLG